MTRLIEDGVPVLVTGLHRLLACRKLGMDLINCIYIDGDETDARLWEISENLHRADLTAQERADQIVEWQRLVAVRRGDNLSPLGGIQPNDKSVKATAKELGVAPIEVRRAAQISKITPEARAAADEAGLVKQNARLEIA